MKTSNLMECFKEQFSISYSIKFTDQPEGMKKYFFFFSLFLFMRSSEAQTPTTWNPVGIGGGGALFSPSISPDNPQDMYIGCDMGGLYHSTDHGSTWKILPFQQIRGGHYSKVNYTNNPLIQYSISYKSGLNDLVTPYKTTDGGATWSKLTGNPDDNETLYALYANYNNPNQVIIDWYNDLYFSNDGGSTFTHIYTGANVGAGCKLSGVFWDGNTIYCGTNDGILRSTNNGASFALWTTSGIASGEVISSFCGAREGNNVRFYALTSSSSDVYNGDDYDYYQYGKHVYRMDNTSATWVNVTNNFDYTTQYVKHIRNAMTDIDTVYLSGETSGGVPMVLRSLNGGSSWNNVLTTTLNQNIQTAWCGAGGDVTWTWAELLFGFDVSPKHSNELLISDYGFIHTSTDGGSNWHQCYTQTAFQHPAGTNTPIHQEYRSAGDLNQISVWQPFWLDSNNVWLCSSDIKGTRSVNGGSTWSFHYNGHTENTSYRMVKNIANNTLYMATSSVHDLYQSTRLANAQLDATGNTGAVKFSTDNGLTWQVLHDFSDIVCWVATDPNNSNILYVSVVNSTNGNGGIWKTSNVNAGASSSWTHLPAPPRTEGHPFNIIVLNDGKVLASYSGHRNPGFTASSGVFLYDGNSWSDRSHAGMFYWTQDVVVDPHDSTQNTWYACVYEGWGVAAAMGVGGLYRTNDRGLTWNKIWSNERCMSATPSPYNTNEMYVTTEYAGLNYTSNLSSSAPNFSQTNYPFRTPMRVFYHPYHMGEIWVSSFGEGVMSGTTLATFYSPEKNKGDLIVYPNPTSGDLYLSSDQGMKELRLYDMKGSLRCSFSLHQGTKQFHFSMKEVEPGCYTLKVECPDGCHPLTVWKN